MWENRRVYEHGEIFAFYVLSGITEGELLT
jgi:hypothetical protein